MMRVLIDVLCAFKTEFAGKNLFGWTITGFSWYLANIEHVNGILTTILSIVSIAWFLIRTYLAIKDRKKS